MIGSGFTQKNQLVQDFILFERRNGIWSQQNINFITVASISFYINLLHIPI